MKIDHIAIQTDDPVASAQWYINNFGAKLVYADKTWAFVHFDNVKLAFVVKEQHPAHFAFEVQEFDKGDRVKKHRDGSRSVYKKDPWGNIYELIAYDSNNESR